MIPSLDSSRYASLEAQLSAERVSTIRRRLQLSGERRGPFLPREVSLLRELDSERERLRFPRLLEGRLSGVARQFLESSESLGIGGGITPAQDSFPRDRCRRNRGTKHARPTARAR
jgi:hypothetical protein